MTNFSEHDQWLQLRQWFSTSNKTISVDQVFDSINQKTKPPGSLGQIEIVAAQLALLQDSLTPSIQNGRVIVFGADHGLAQEGVSAFPAEVTAQMMANFDQGGAAVCVVSAANDLQVEVVDVGVKSDISFLTNVIHAKVAQGTQNFANHPAMSDDELTHSMNVGRDAIRRAIAHNTDCVGLGEMGIANTSSASAIVAMLLNLPAHTVTGRGTGVDDHALQHKRDVIQSAIDRHDAQSNDTMSVLRKVGGLEIAAMTGAMLEAHQHQLPVLVDGFISTTAALAAVRHKPEIRSCLIFSHQSAEAGHAKILEALNAFPLLRLNMRLGEGSAAALAFPLLKASCAMLSNMSTFAQAGVSDKSE